MENFATYMENYAKFGQKSNQTIKKVKSRRGTCLIFFSRITTNGQKLKPSIYIIDFFSETEMFFHIYLRSKFSIDFT